MKLLRTGARHLHATSWGCSILSFPARCEAQGSATRGRFSPVRALNTSWPLSGFLVILSMSAAALMASPAQAGQPVAGAIIGGSAGALVGQAVGGRDGAIVGAAIGAAAGVASVSRTGVHGTSVQVGVGYAPSAVYPAPVYGAPYGVSYGTVYGAVPPLYAPVAPVVVAPPVLYRPPAVYVSPTVVAPAYVSRAPRVVHHAPTVVHRAPRVIHTRAPQKAYRGNSRAPRAGSTGVQRGHGHRGKRH